MKPIGVVVNFDLVHPPITERDPIIDQSAPTHDLDFVRHLHIFTPITCVKIECTIIYQHNTYFSVQVEIYRPPGDLNITVNRLVSRIDESKI